MKESPAIVVIGCGAWGRNHVRVFNELGVLYAVADADAVRAADVARGVDRPTMAVGDVAADPSVDAVVIATPPGAHAALARSMLAAGKDLLVEKPLALNLTDARELCQLAEATSRVLMVGHLMRYHPAFVAMARLVNDGDLGRTQYLYSNRLNLGRFRREENILWSFAPHDISMILALIGSEPDAVIATGAAFLDKTLVDVTTTHLSFPTGVHAHVFVSWLHPVKEQRLVVIGDRGMAVFDDTRDWPEKLTVFRHHVDWRAGLPQPVHADGRFVPIDPVEPLSVECSHFLECVKTRRVPITDGREGLRVLGVLDRAQRSLDRQQLPAAKGFGAFVHPSSFVDEDVVLGAGTTVWHFCHIMPGARVGRECTLGQNVHVGPRVVIGDRVRIQNNVSVFEGVTLEDDVFCGPACTFTNVLNPRAEVDKRVEFRPTLVRRGATIGANATILCGTELGAYAFVGAGAVVTSDVKPHALVVGVPARQVGWVSHDGEVLDEGLVCRRSGRQYELLTGQLRERPRDN